MSDTNICYNCGATMTDEGDELYVCPVCGDVYDPTYEGDVPIPVAEDEDFVDTTPICLACGEKMDWTGEYREIEIDLMTFEEPIYACYNPDCFDEDDEES